MVRSPWIMEYDLLGKTWGEMWCTNVIKTWENT